MKNRRILKPLALLLSLLMLMSMLVLPMSAEEPTLADKLAVYNLVAKSDDDLAKLESVEYVNENNNGYLQMTSTSSGAYPYFYFNAEQVPADLTDYTYTIDMMCLSDAGQTNYVVYGVPTDTSKHGTVGINPDNGQIKGNDWIYGTSLYMGQGDFSKCAYGAGVWHTFEITVKKTAENATTVTIKVDNIALSGYTDREYVLASSTVGVCLYKGKTVGIDNVKVVDNSTGTVVYKDDFSTRVVAVDDISSYRTAGAYTAPTQTDMAFAGWYTDADCTTPLAADKVDGAAYAKFVPAAVMDIKAQITNNTDASSETTDLRLVSTVDSTQYSQAGFLVSYNGGEAMECFSKNAYSALTGAGITYTPDTFSVTSQYFVTYAIKNIGNAHFGNDFTVTPVWVTLDGTTVVGTARTTSITDLIPVAA